MFRKVLAVVIALSALALSSCGVHGDSNKAEMVTTTKQNAIVLSAEYINPTNAHNGNPQSPYACWVQMAVLREVSNQAGITIGSETITPSHGYAPRKWANELHNAGLVSVARAVGGYPDTVTAGAFLLAMTRAAASILAGNGDCAPSRLP